MPRVGEVYLQNSKIEVLDMLQFKLSAGFVAVNEPKVSLRNI